MSRSISTRHAWVVQSDIRSMSTACSRMGGINLAQGVCDTEVPLPVRQGAQNAIDTGYNIYTRAAGLDELRRAIAAKQYRLGGMELDPEHEIIVSAGATGAMYCTCLALLEPGDEVIVFEPYYGYHISTLRAVQAVPVYVRLNPPDWSFALEELQAAISPRTRAIILNTPANPCGKVFSEEEIRRIGEVAQEHDLFIFTDEIYEHFIFDGLGHISPATLPGLRERTITISGLSKTYSITGWRIGYCMGDARWMQAIGNFNDLIYVCAPSPLQIGAAKGLLELGSEYYTGLAQEYHHKRDLICTALKTAGLQPYVPQGAYYVLADISHIPGATARQRALHILEATGVACVPGNAFFDGDGGENLARFCFAKQDDILAEACERLQKLNT